MAPSHNFVSVFGEDVGWGVGGGGTNAEFAGGLSSPNKISCRIAKVLEIQYMHCPLLILVRACLLASCFNLCNIMRRYIIFYT